MRTPMRDDVKSVELPHSWPGEVGFSEERLNYADNCFADNVEKGEMAGIVTLVARHGELAHFNAVGYADAKFITSA